MTRRTAALALPAALLVLTLMVGVVACGDDGADGGTGGGGQIPAEPESGQITMGTQPWIGYGPWHIADQQGFFQDAGVEVELTNFTTDDQLNSAFASGRMDVANVATHTALKLIAADLPVTIVLLEDVSTTADAILAGPGIDSIQDLAGERVAYEEGTTSDILLRYALQQNEMTIDDVEKVPLPAADAGSAAIAGRVPAAVTYEPYLTTALNEDPQFELLYTAEENPGLISDVLVVSEEMLESRPGQIAALMEAWGASVDYYRTDTADAQRIISEAVGANVGELRTAFEGVEFFDIDQNVEELSGRFAEETVREVAEVAAGAGIIEEQPQTDGIIDARFVEEAASR